MINFGVQLFLHDQSADLSQDKGLLNLELILQSLDRKRLVLVLTLNHEDSQGFLLESVEQGCLEGAILELRHLLEDLDLTDVIESFLPVALVEVSGGKNDVVSAILSHKLDSL